jgi:hypothetical protein
MRDPPTCNSFGVSCGSLESEPEALDDPSTLVIVHASGTPYPMHADPFEGEANDALSSLSHEAFARILRVKPIAEIAAAMQVNTAFEGDRADQLRLVAEPD